jgi:SPP1 gp7 family putative phage head morphogenesis protein
MPDPQRLPFAQAIAYFREQLAIPSDRWEVIWAEIGDYASALAALTQAEILNDIYQEILKALEQGTTLQQFKQDFDRIVAQRGWTEGQGYTPWRKELLFSQNLRTAYASGRYEQMSDPAVTAARPYWIWKHRDSRNPRPAHLALHNKVFSFDDPFWATGFPPCGFGCRCAVFTLSDRDLDRRGLKVTASPTETVTIRDRVTGATQKVPAIAVDGTLHPITEPGFAHAPGANRQAQRAEIVQRTLDRLPPDLKKLVEQNLGRT